MMTMPLPTQPPRGRLPVTTSDFRPAPIVTLRVASLLSLLLPALMACEPPAKGAPPVFGGEGASLSERGEPLPANVDESVLEGPCSPAAPAGQGTLIDDFEDGDQRPFRQFQREGWWFSAADSSAGEISPKPNAFKAEALPQQESTPSNRMAAHFVASGYSDWGVSWGTTLSWVDSGIKCPFNASAFDGFRFKAKGKGRVRVHLGVPETVPKDQEGGRCSEKCWDTHSRVVMLTDEWETYEVPWEQLQQWGWGTEAKFDPSEVLSLQFAVSSNDLPVDFWVDDVEFIQTDAKSSAPQVTAPANTAAANTAPANTATVNTAPLNTATLNTAPAPPVAPSAPAPATPSAAPPSTP